MGTEAEVRSIDIVCAGEEPSKSTRSEVRDELYAALDKYCLGKIKLWNEKMDEYIEQIWRKAYINDFADEYSNAVFHEVLELKQRQLDPAEYK
ncbi:hypothetical protein KY343_02550 [Candidatus Woesearchaeota archaeon]|nr:hypothetical protein [Candidatus Woesearchaeota archaeon]